MREIAGRWNQSPIRAYRLPSDSSHGDAQSRLLGNAGATQGQEGGDLVPAWRPVVLLEERVDLFIGLCT